MGDGRAETRDGRFMMRDGRREMKDERQKGIDGRQEMIIEEWEGDKRWEVRDKRLEKEDRRRAGDWVCDEGVGVSGGHPFISNKKSRHILPGYPTTSNFLISYTASRVNFVSCASLSR